MIKINLLPVREERRRLGVRQQYLLMGLVLVLVAIGLFYWHSSTVGRLKQLRNQIVQIDQEISRLSKVVQEVEQFKKDKKILEEKLGVIGELKKNRLLPVHMMDEINKALTPRAWLEFFQEANGVVTLRGKALSAEDIANFMRNLESSPYFSDVELLSTSLQEASVGGVGVKVNDFSLQCKVTTGSLKPAAPVQKQA